MIMSMMPRARLVVVLLLVGACHATVTTAPGPGASLPQSVIPAPTSIDVSPRDSFTVTPRTVVYVAADASPEIQAIGNYAANLIASRAGATVQRLTGDQPDSSISLTLDAARTNLGAEGYELTSTPRQVRIVAAQPAGLFYGVQTMRQLLPPAVEHQAGINRKLKLPVAHVLDTPRFAWRGGMLDVARHFMPAADVKRFIDAYALYKLNRLHLHLADDQGWRIQINSWPRLTEIASRTAVGDQGGGFYTQAEYADIVAYARSRYITIVPEIDMPGHINAALNVYPDLKCDRVAPEPYTRIGGPPNSLCVTRDSIYGFVGDVVREIASIAPTPYFHIGGDEVQHMSRDDYRNFITHVESIVTGIGPRMIGWSEIAPLDIKPTTIVQHWTRDSAFVHAQRGGQIIMSPGAHAYLDMKYDSSTALGLLWAGAVNLHRAYDWNPATWLPGVGEQSVLGVEAPLWAETLIRPTDWQYMEFPRIIATAEVGWSATNRVNWEDFRQRIGKHGARLAALGINFAREPGIDWTW